MKQFDYNEYLKNNALLEDLNEGSLDDITNVEIKGIKNVEVFDGGKSLRFKTKGDRFYETSVKGDTPEDILKDYKHLKMVIDHKKNELGDFDAKLKKFIEKYERDYAMVQAYEQIILPFHKYHVDRVKSKK